MTEPISHSNSFSRKLRTPHRGVLFFFAIAALLGIGRRVPPAPAAGKPALTLYAFEQPHMGTLFRIKLYASAETKARVAATAAFKRIEELNQILSDYLPRSEVNRLVALAPGETTPVSRDLEKVLLTSFLINRGSDGAYDPTLGHFTNLWRRAVRKGHLPTGEQLADARARTGLDKIEVITESEANRYGPKVTGMILDFGGIAKGYAADRALEVLEEHGITRAAVAAGGDIRLGEPPPGDPRGWEVPVLSMDRDRERLTTTLRLKNAAISTSGDREQFVKIDGVTYSHIVDPRTGLGLTRRITVTVIAPRAELSDPLATTLCLLGPEAGLALLENFADPGPGEVQVHALIIVRDENGEDHDHFSPGFPREAKEAGPPGPP